MMKSPALLVIAAYFLGVAVAHPSDRLSLGFLLVSALILISAWVVQWTEKP